MRLPLLLAAAVAAVVLSPAAAQAGTASVRDQRGDVSSPNDILSTRVTNARRIGVVIHHRDLRRNAVDIQFKVHTPGGGNNWTVYAALDGSYSTVYRSGSNPQTRSCAGLRVGRSLKKDVTHLSVPRSCVSSPKGKIALRPRVQWSADGSKGDWSVNGNHHFTRFVPR